MTTLNAKQSFWQQHVQQAEDFEGSLADYARANDLAVRSLYQWRSQLGQESVKPTTETRFTQVTPISNLTSQFTVYLGPAQMVFSALPEPRWLHQVIAGD